MAKSKATNAQGELLVGFEAPTNLAVYLAGPACEVTDSQRLFLALNGQGRGVWKAQYERPVTRDKTKMSYGECWLASVDGKKKVMGMTVELARKEHQAARAQLAVGIDPNVAREEAKVEALDKKAKEKAAEKAALELKRDNTWRKVMGKPPKDSFADCVNRWAESQAERQDPLTLKNATLNIAKWGYPLFGLAHVNDVTTDDVGALNDAMEHIPYSLMKARRTVSDVCIWAAHRNQKLRTTGNPVEEEKELFDDLPDAKHHHAFTEIEDIRGLMLDINAPAENWVTKPQHCVEMMRTVQAALRLIAATGQRSHNVTKAQREHFDLDAGTWSIPAILMKGKVVKKRKPGKPAHVVYLSRQTVAVLRVQFARFPDSRWVFPGNAGSGAMGVNYMYKHLNSMGYQFRHSVHGFRAMMRTAGQEFANLSPLVLETTLAHEEARKGQQGVADMIKAFEAFQKMMNGEMPKATGSKSALDGGMPGVYSRKTQDMKAQWEQQCRDVAQGWADWLDKIQRPRLALAA